MMRSQTIRNFSEYLCLSVTNPNILRSPYTREQKQILTYMSWLKTHLAEQAADMDATALVSVIMPTFNRVSVLRRAVLSVLTQSMPHLELVIVDDGSTDGTSTLVRSFTDERIRLIRGGTNRGPSHARNVGLDAARGKYIAFLDSDDWWDHHFLRIMVSTLQVTDHRFAYSAQRVIRPGGQSSQPRRPELIRFAPYNASLLENNNYISQIAVLHETALALEVNGFNETYRRFADWEYFLRLAASSPPLAIPVVLSHYNQSAQASVSSSVNRAEYLERLRNDLASESIDISRLLSAPSQGPGCSCDEPRASDQDARTLAANFDVSVSASPQDSVTDRAPESVQLFALRRPSLAVAQRKSLIVIYSHGFADYLRLCLVSVLRFTDEGTFRIVVVDNAPDVPVTDVLDEFERHPQVHTIRNTTDLGFSGAVKRGVECVDLEEDVVIMSRDAVVTPGWLNELSATAHRYPDAGIVAPRRVRLPGDEGHRVHVPAAVSDFEIDVNLSAQYRNVIDPFFDTQGNVIELDYVPFLCVLLRREVIEAIGPLTPDNGDLYQSAWVYSDAVRHVAHRRILHTARSKVYHLSVPT